MIEALIILYTSLLLLLTITEIKGNHRFTAKYFYETDELNWLANRIFSAIINIVMLPEKIIYYMIKLWRYRK